MNNMNDFVRAVYDRIRSDRRREVIRFDAGWIAAAVIPAVVLTLIYIMCNAAPFGDKLLLIQSQFFDEIEIDGYFILIPDVESYVKILGSLGLPVDDLISE